MLSKMKVAIFDMDGTVLDSMGAWRNLNSAFVRSRGIEPTPEQEADMYGMSGSMVISYFKEQFGIDSDFETLCEEACGQMEPIYDGGVPFKPGAQAYLERLRAQGVTCVLATATPARLALIGLNRAHATRYFDYIYSTDMFAQGKNDPAFFDDLCGRIGADKSVCVMFEDAVYAMRGARKANLLGVVGITDSTNVSERDAIRAVCDVLIDSYDEI